jgi:uncharacterized protein
MQCPTCHREVEAGAAGQPDSSFPFCSERCRLIDLGRWLDGKYQIPISLTDEDEPEATKEMDE